MHINSGSIRGLIDRGTRQQYSKMRSSGQFQACLFFLRKDFARTKSTKTQNKQLSPFTLLEVCAREKLLPQLFSVCLILFCWLMFACNMFLCAQSLFVKKIYRLEIVLITSFYYTTYIYVYIQLFFEIFNLQNSRKYLQVTFLNNICFHEHV